MINLHLKTKMAPRIEVTDGHSRSLQVEQRHGDTVVKISKNVYLFLLFKGFVSTSFPSEVPH